MDKFAVIKLGGSQYLVKEGEVFEVEKIEKPEPEVSLYYDSDNVLVGQPTLSNINVTLSVVEQKKGKKIDVIRFRAKSRHRRKIGFRPSITVVKVDKIFKE